VKRAPAIFGKGVVCMRTGSVGGQASRVLQQDHDLLLDLSGGPA